LQLQARLGRRVQRGELLHRIGGELLLIDRAAGGRSCRIGRWWRSRQGEDEQRGKMILRMVTSSG
jgi:hypothetical protein